MAISSLSAAKTVCELSEWTLSNLALQKILYIAHLIYVGRNNGEPLLDESFQAWEYGPVLPSVYQKTKVFGSDPVKNVFHSVPSVEPGEEFDILSSTVDSLANERPGKLVAITHMEGGAWSKNYEPGKLFNTIPNQDVFEEYGFRWNG